MISFQMSDDGINSKEHEDNEKVSSKVNNIVHASWSKLVHEN